MKSHYDVLIVGGGPAGLGAAMALGRMSRQTLVCDDERPRNAPSAHMNNFPSHDGVHPAEWRRLARKDLEKYATVEFHKGSVLELAKEGWHFRAAFSSGETASFRKVILASGVLDRLPSIPGFQDLWGKSVFHCPYCHGFEVRGARLGLVANGKFAEHILPMMFSLSRDCVLYTNGPAELSDEFKANLQRRYVRLIETRIKALIHDGDRLTAVALENGESHEREGLFLAPGLPFQSKSQLGEQLGCEKTEMGFYKLGEFGKTSVDGVFAAGDISSGLHSVLGAAASGQMAGAGAVSELLKEDFTAP